MFCVCILNLFINVCFMTDLRYLCVKTSTGFYMMGTLTDKGLIKDVLATYLES